MPQTITARILRNLAKASCPVGKKGKQMSEHGKDGAARCDAGVPVAANRLYLCEHRTRAGRFGLIKILAATWAEAEEIARRVFVADASPLEVTGYQDGDWDDTIPAHVDPTAARAFVEAAMRAVREALR